jgi:hypothetical protein
VSRAREEYQLHGAYEHDYEVQVLVDLPTSQSIARYGSGSGAILRILPRASAQFIFIVDDNLDKLQLLSWPDPEALVVMPGAFLISTRDPGGSSRKLAGFEGHSVHYVHQLHSPNVVLIGHCCAIYCYDREGLRWAWDDLFCCQDPKIDIAGDDLILLASKHGTGHDTPHEMIVSLSTGKLR